MTEYSVEKFYDEYAIKKEDTIIAVIDTGTNARKVCDLLNEQDAKIREQDKHEEKLFSYFFKRFEEERGVDHETFCEMWFDIKYGDDEND